MPRFTPMLGGALPSLASPVRARLGQLRTNAAGTKRTTTRTSKRATTRRPARRASKGRAEHLRVRSPSSFKKSTFKTIPWTWANAQDRAFVQKKLGMRTIPKGTKVVEGAFKPGAKKDRIPGKRVRYLGRGIQAVLVPIKGGKTPKSPAGTPRKSKPTVKRIVRRARGNPAGTTTRGAAFEHHHVRPPASFVPGSYRTVKPSHVSATELRDAKKKARMTRLPSGSEIVVAKFRKGAQGRVRGKRGKTLEWGVVKILTPAPRRNDCVGVHTHGDARQLVALYEKGRRKNPAPAAERRRYLDGQVAKMGASRVHQSLVRLKNALAQAGQRGYARTVEQDLDWLAKHYELGRGGGVSRNPGRLVLLNPLPKEIEECRKKMRPAARTQFDQLATKLSKAELHELAQAAKGYKTFHGCWPSELVCVGKADGTQHRFRYGLGKADHVGYHTNTKKYARSNKGGVPFQHEFEHGQELMATADGKRLAIVNRRKRGTKITNWIRG